MSKEKTLRTLEETEVMQTAGIPSQETEANNLEKDWEFCSQQRLILAMQTDIIDFTLKIFDYKCLSMALSYLKAVYNQQPPEEEEEQEGEE